MRDVTVSRHAKPFRALGWRLASRAALSSRVAGAARVGSPSCIAASPLPMAKVWQRGRSDLRQQWLATMGNRTRHSHRQLDGEQVDVGAKFSNGCRFPGDTDAPYAETMNCRCTLIAAVAGVDMPDAKRWSRLPKGTTYEQWKGAKAKEGRKARAAGAAGSDGEPRDVGSAPASSGKAAEAKDRIARTVRSYIDESRKMGLAAPGFRPRPRKAVELPRDEYASVMSAINNVYHVRFEGKSKARIAVGNHVYTFELHGFDEYKITRKEPLE